ncbi:MAG: YIP1 family protein [Maritimibacter sp.]
MSVVKDILAAYRRPRAVFRRRLGDTIREDRAIAVLMAACLVIFVAQWPRLMRQSMTDAEVPLEALMGGTLLGWLFFVPLFAYALGGVTKLILNLFGGKTTWFSARFALFWALLVASPLWLLWGLVAGYIGPGQELQIVGFIALTAFLVHWIVNLTIVARGSDAH